MFAADEATRAVVAAQVGDRQTLDSRTRSPGASLRERPDVCLGRPHVAPIRHEGATRGRRTIQSRARESDALPVQSLADRYQQRRAVERLLDDAVGLVE